MYVKVKRKTEPTNS